MFSMSSQLKNWMFKSESQLINFRKEANENFIENQKEKGIAGHFLTPSEEKHILKHYEYVLRDFCRKFQPPMPRSVMGTAFHYFKRFYLHNSVMDYHPKHIVVTCIYLASKVEEFNVSISQFVANIRGDREKATDVILNNELLLMQQLNYHLTIHNPFRPVEGFMIDLKTKHAHFGDPEHLRPVMDDFLDQLFFTDCCLLYSPSQISLAALSYAASKKGLNLDFYINELCSSGSREQVTILKDAIKHIWMSFKNIEVPQKALVRTLEKKLEDCRNQDNNPDSQQYKRKMQEMLEDDEMESSVKYARISEEQRMDEDALLMRQLSDSS